MRHPFNPGTRHVQQQTVGNAWFQIRDDVGSPQPFKMNHHESFIMFRPASVAQPASDFDNNDEEEKPLQHRSTFSLLSQTPTSHQQQQTPHRTPSFQVRRSSEILQQIRASAVKRSNSMVLFRRASNRPSNQEDSSVHSYKPAAVAGLEPLQESDFKVPTFPPSQQTQ